MANFQVITFENYMFKRWQRHGDYTVAGDHALCALVAQELPKAVLAMPIGFVAEGDRFLPVAVQGLTPGKNLLVAADGRWLTSYVPAAYRGYPFHMAKTDQGERVLCIDEDSGLISDTEGEPFFDEEGAPSQSVMGIVEFFAQIEANQEVTRVGCVALQKHNLIQPWVINVQNDGGETKLEGLFRIDETALNALTAEALVELRDAGALTIAYCQLLSMQHLPVLGSLARAHAEADRNLQAQASMGESDTFSFGNLS